MSELQTYYTEYCQAGVWKHWDSALCGCRGSGWWSSEVDTVHQCSNHYRGQQHPDDDTDPTLYAVTILVTFVVMLTPAWRERLEREREQAARLQFGDDDIPF